MSQPLRLGTRGSPLALVQAQAVAEAIESATNRVCEIVVIRTSGDRLTEARLADVGGKGLFVKEIEEALSSGAIDLAVHSRKDMPAVTPAGLSVAAVLPREDPRDAFVLAAGARHADIEAVLARLGRSPRIGTSSVRRAAQLKNLLPDASFLPIRGNLDTRLRKLDSGEFDAIVLASAGLKRLQHGERISASIPVQSCVPSPGQGIVAIEIRSRDASLHDMLSTIDDPDAHAALNAERMVVSTLGGGCQMPIAALAVIEGRQLALTALVASLDGARIVRSDAHGTVDEASEIGARAARELLERGAGDILATVERAQRAAEGHSA
jgi:hydroxymethylbilane synthase